MAANVPTLNNGIFLREARYELTESIDQYHIMKMVGESKPTDLGVIDLWALGRYRERSLYNLATFNQRNTVEVTDPDGRFTWRTPVASELPRVIRDLDPTNTRKGIGGDTFQVLFDKKFSNNAIITYDKFNGVRLKVTEDEIVETGDGYIHTVTVVETGEHTYLDNKYLAPMTKWFEVSSYRDEFTQQSAGLRMEGGYREFYNFVGASKASRHFHITDRAAMIARKLMAENGAFNMVEVYNVKGANIDPSIKTIDDIIMKKGIDGLRKMIANGEVSMGLMTKLEAALLDQIMMDIENELMWGTGGIVQDAGQGRTGRLSVGFWKQTDNGYKTVYTKKNFSLKMFRSTLYNFFHGKKELLGPNPDVKLTAYVGMGAFQLINEMLREEIGASGLTFRGDKGGIGAVTGDPMNLHYGFHFTSFTTPFLANVEFVIHPALDTYHTNEIENPLVDGYPLSSYSILVFDQTDLIENNLLKLEWAYDKELTLRYQNGTMDYLGRRVFQSSGDFSGFKLEGSKTKPAVFVKDPTKIMKFVMKNPVTGFTL